MSDQSSRTPLPLYVLLACSIALNLVLLLHRGPSATPEETAESEAPAAAVPAQASAAAAAAMPTAAAQPAAATADGWKVLHGNVEESLARTFQVGGGDDGDALSSVYTRLFVWDLDLRRDMQKGDSVAVAWRTGPDGVPVIAVANLQSKKLGKTVTAYRWQAPGDAFPSYWHPDGTEAPLRLKNGPLASYDQITSLLKDRPTHKGMDFKTPIGTEVHTPRDGVVTRVNWNWTANGNCVEVRYEDGVLAKFLHLSENKVVEGAHVAAGQVIALSGNTGHSTAPHLHYQLDQGEKVLDPLDYHGTVRRSLTPEQTTAMKRDVASYDALLAGGAAQ